MRRAALSRAAAMPLLLVGSLSLLGALAADVASPGLVEHEPPPPPAEALPTRPAKTAGRYVLRAELDPTRHVVVGEGTITFTNTSRAALDHLWVHLYLNAFESDRTLFQRGPADGFRGGAAAAGGRIDVKRFAVSSWGGEDLWPERATTPGDPHDRTDVHVPLPREIAPGETVELDVAWDAHLPPVTLRTGWSGSFHMVAQWFPKIAKLEPDGRFEHFPFERLAEFYADFVDWDVTVTTPATFLVGATGAQVEERRDAGRVARRFVQHGVHDFAFAAWDRFEELRSEHRGVTLRCLHPPGLRRVAELEVEVARRALDHLGARWGPYPFETLTLVHPPASAPEAGGMEYPTLVTTGGPWWAPLVGVRSAELVTVHEIAHQWFQGVVASNEREHPFLDEGLATFAEIDAMRALVPPGSTASLALGLPIAAEPWHRAYAVEPARRVPVATPARGFVDASDYGALVYGRAATVLRTLDRVHDGAIRRALATYARRHRFGHPTPDDLVRAVRDEAGEDAAATLRSALFESGWIDVSLDEVTSAPSGDGFDVAVSLSREGTLELPVDVEVVDAAGRTHRLRWDGRGQRVVLEAWMAAAPTFARLDPDHALLLDDDLLDGAWASRPAPPIAARSWGALGFAARAALAVLGP